MIMKQKTNKKACSSNFVIKFFSLILFFFTALIWLVHFSCVFKIFTYVLEWWLDHYFILIISTLSAEGLINKLVEVWIVRKNLRLSQIFLMQHMIQHIVKLGCTICFLAEIIMERKLFVLMKKSWGKKKFIRRTR